MDEKDIARALAAQIGTPPDARNLRMWIVTEKPSDFPNSFVAREWMFARGGVTNCGRFVVSPALEPLRDAFMLLGFTCLARHPSDDPVVKEIWL